MKKHRLRKSERLCDQNIISNIFSSGKTLKEFPLYCRFLSSKLNEEEIQVLFSVPKKIIKSAAKRNLLKRRMREAYRINNTSLKELAKQNLISLQIAFIWNNKEIMPFKDIENKIIILLERLSETHEKTIC